MQLTRNVALRNAAELVRATLLAWLEDKGTRMGAALAFYAIFSLGPLLIFAIAIAGSVFGETAASGEVHRQLRGVVGVSGARFVESWIAGAQAHGASVVTAGLSLVTLLVAATAVVIQLKDALNSIWSVRPLPGRSLKALVDDYAVAMVALLGGGLLLTAAVLASAGLINVEAFFRQVLPLPPALVRAAELTSSFVLVTLFFAAIFKLLPDVRIGWRDVWGGALGTAVLFSLGRSLVGFYLSTQTFDTSYGAAASVVAMLVWFYYFANILYIGAEFTKVSWRRRHGAVVPGAHVEVVARATTPRRRRALL